MRGVCMRKLNMPRRLSSSAARTHGGNMLFMLPTIILFCIVVLIPFFQGIPYSFTNWKSIVSETKEFNGLKNYIYLIKNKYFQDSLLVTFKFTILYMISANVMGLLLALAIHRSSWFNNIARTVLFLPFTVSGPTYLPMFTARSPVSSARWVCPARSFTVWSSSAHGATWVTPC